MESIYYEQKPIIMLMACHKVASCFKTYAACQG